MHAGAVEATPHHRERRASPFLALPHPIVSVYRHHAVLDSSFTFGRTHARIGDPRLYNGESPSVLI
jgi:hypothetical protein